MAMSTITIETAGRRLYLRGDTYSVRDRIRAIGGHWDADAKAWWVGAGKRAEAEKLATEAAAEPATTADAERKGDGEDTVVAGRVTYRGQSYYVVGRTVRGRTHWDDTVAAVQTRDGAKILVCSRDGATRSWVGRGEVEVLKRYDRPQTIGSLRRFAADARAGVSRADYQAEIDGAEDQDCFGAARNLEQTGYAEWRRQQTTGGAA